MSKRCMGCMKLFGDEFEICPHCGYIVGTRAQDAIHIEPGIVLHNRYTVGKVIHSDNFESTYIAWDETLDQIVEMGEYSSNTDKSEIQDKKIV